MSKLILPTVAIAVFIISYLSCGEDEPYLDQLDRIELIGKEKERALEFFIIDPLDKSYQADGRIQVSYTNLSGNLRFQITKTGLKYYYPLSDKAHFTSSSSHLSLEPLGTTQLEVTCKVGSRNPVGYCFLDDVRVFRHSK